MTNSAAIHQPKKSNNTVVPALQDALSSSYGLLLSTHNYHWNVEGENFVSLHRLFEEQYNELFTAIDVIAERIRALDLYVIPFEANDLTTNSKTILRILNNKSQATECAKSMVGNLITLNEGVVENFNQVKEAAKNAGDDETEDLAVARIAVHQKALWMLKSIIK